MTVIARVAERLLAAVLGRDRAATAIGDLQEEFARRRDATQPFRRFWLLTQMARLFAASLGTIVPGALRTWGYTLRDAIRGLRAAPATMALAAAILALGMAAAIITFSVVDHVVLRRLPFPDEHRLVTIYANNVRGRTLIVAPQDYLAWQQTVPAIEHIAAWAPRLTTIGSGAGAERVPSVIATAALFSALQVHPMLGRTLGPEHEIDGADKVVVLSHTLWQQRFSADLGIVGRSVEIGGVPHQILGVMPPEFEFPVGDVQPAMFWRPYVPRPDERAYQPGGGRASYLRVLGRLREGATIEQALGQLEAATSSLGAQQPQFYRDFRVQVAPLRDLLVGGVRGWMLLVLWSVVLVLGVVCVNVANLLLARSVVRARDFAVRASLGATRAQLIRALIAESLILALIAGAAGVGVSSLVLGFVKSALPEGIARATNIALDARVYVAALVAVVATGLTFGMVPAWQASRADISAILKGGGTSTGSRARRRWRSGLLIAEVSVVVVLLLGTALLVTSFVRIMRADLGFVRQNLIGVSVSLSWPGVPAAERSSRSREFFRRAKEILEQTNGVARVAHLAGGELPFYGSSATMSVRLPGSTDDSQMVDVEFRRASDGYFDAAGIRLLHGRVFDASDRATDVVVLDEIAARRLFGTAAAAGSRLHLNRDDELTTVIGIVSNVRLAGPEGEQLPQLYLPWSLDGAQGGSPMIVVRTSTPAAGVVPAIEAALAPLMPPGNRPPRVTVVDDLYRQLTADRRFNAGLMSVFGAIALLVGAAGIYSVMASVVAQQTREIGIRCALGATRSRIAGVVLSDAARQVTCGLAIGLIAGWLLSRFISSLLFNVQPGEPALYAAVVAVLAATALAAAWIPARRASRVDPIVALKE